MAEDQPPIYDRLSVHSIAIVGDLNGSARDFGVLQNDRTICRIRVKRILNEFENTLVEARIELFTEAAQNFR
jgi:hypothetical protein